MNNPKVNYTEEDTKKYLENLFLSMIVKKEYPAAIKKARRLAKKFLKQQNK